MHNSAKTKISVVYIFVILKIKQLFGQISRKYCLSFNG